MGVKMVYRRCGRKATYKEMLKESLESIEYQEEYLGDLKKDCAGYQDKVAEYDAFLLSHGHTGEGPVE